MSGWQSRHKHAWRRTVFGWTAVAVLLTVVVAVYRPGPVWASSVEYRVKAAFLYNFTKFIEWPAVTAKRADPFRIGILGDDPFEDEIDGLKDKTVGPRSLTVERFSAWQPAVAQCDILFISGSQSTSVADIVQRLDGHPVLTVGDSPGYPSQGVMINFFMESNKVRFAVNPTAVQRAGLAISSRLLKLAVIVDDRRPEK